MSIHRLILCWRKRTHLAKPDCESLHPQHDCSVMTTHQRRSNYLIVLFYAGGRGLTLRNPIAKVYTRSTTAALWQPTSEGQTILLDRFPTMTKYDMQCLKKNQLTAEASKHQCRFLVAYLWATFIFMAGFVIANTCHENASCHSVLVCDSKYLPFCFGLR